MSTSTDTVTDFLVINTETADCEEFTGRMYYDEGRADGWEAGLTIGDEIDEEWAYDVDKEDAWVGNVVVLRGVNGIIDTGFVQHMDVLENELVVMCKDPTRFSYDDVPSSVRDEIETDNNH